MILCTRLLKKYQWQFKIKYTVITAKSKILVIAYACNPYKGSEHGVGWGWLGIIARENAVWCIVSLDNKQDIEHFCMVHPESHYASVQYVFVEHRWNQKLNSIWPPYYLWQFKRQWQRDAYVQAQYLYAEQKFDLCHLITYVGYRIPGDFYKLDCPFAWGPIGGLENTPWRLLPAMGGRGAIYYACRNLINTLQKFILLKPKKAFRKASETGTVIAATSSIQREIKKWYGVKSAVICEVGPPSVEANQRIRVRRQNEPLRISWSGQHMPGKALPLLLKALARLPSTLKWELDILGDGPCRKKWMKQAERLCLNSCINWHGMMPRSDALKIMGSSHVFVITSLKDLTSSVLLEALSVGVPVICPDHCGFSDVVDEKCGKKVPIMSPWKMVSYYEKGIKDFFIREDLREQMAAAALQRIMEFSWERKSEQLRDALGRANGS